MKTYQKTIVLIVILIIIFFIYMSKKVNIINIANQEIVSTTSSNISANEIILDKTDFYEISANYPLELRDKNFIMKKTISDIVKVKQKEWKIGGGLYNEEQSLKKQYPDRPAIKYELNIQYDKYESKDKGTTSYVFKSYEFTGGAHGNTSLFTYTFNDGGLVYIDKFLNFEENNNAIKLTNLVKEKLIKNLGDLYNPEMLNNGLSDVYTNFDNFVVLDNGIKFIFGQYQVAPYAAGQPEVMLSWEELKAHIN